MGINSFVRIKNEKAGLDMHGFDLPMELNNGTRN